MQQQAPKEKKDLIWTTVNDIICQNLRRQEREELYSLLVENQDVILGISEELEFLPRQETWKC